MTLLRKTHNILSDLIAFPTISTDSNLEMINYIANYLDGFGITAQIFHDKTNKKANLFATIGAGDNDKQNGIVLSGHSDVVPVDGQNWSYNPFKMIENDGKLYGRGACDMKGFIATVLALCKQFTAKPLVRPLHFAFTHDEETGCLGAQELVKILVSKKIAPKIAIIGEPTEMAMIEGHKGCYEYATEFQGLPGHASRPELGVNAVEYAVDYAAHLKSLRAELVARTPQDGKFTPPFTTLNIGSIHGGIAPNVIAASCKLEWDMRPVQDGDADYVKQEMQHYCQHHLLPEMQKTYKDASIITRILGEVDGLVPALDNKATELVAQLTGANEAGLVAFGTEAGLFQAMGMDVVVCGPGSIEQAHKADEFVSLAQLQASLDMLEKLAGRLYI